VAFIVATCCVSLQVAKKCGEVYQLIATQPSPTWQLYAQLMFATKVMGWCSRGMCCGGKKQQLR
jgi:hypothetical protein